MKDLSYRKTKIQQKRKQTPWRQFVMELCSRYGMTFHKQWKRVNGYPDVWRISLASFEQFEALRWSEYSLCGSTFMEQFASLYQQHPFPYIHQIGDNENSTYASSIYGAKNAYLSTEVIFASNVLYSAGVKSNSNMVLNSVNIVWDNANVYMSNTVRKSFNIFYSKWVFGSSDVRFSTNLQWCNHCLFCNNLQNASYRIKNKQYSKAQYEQLKQQILSQKEKYNNWYQSLQQPATINSLNAKWRGVVDAKHLENGYFTSKISLSRNVFFAWWGENNSNFYDTVLAWIPYGSDMYAVWWATWEHYYCCVEVIESSHIFYSMYLENCSYCLGCIGLKNKQYCIFNKQYVKEERYEKVDQIFSQMEQDWTLGNFFSWLLCPHYFNDTAAYLIDPSFTQEEVQSYGYAWRDETIQTDIPEWVGVVKSSELGQYEWVKSDSSIRVKRNESEESYTKQTESYASQDPTATPLDDKIHWERSIDPMILKKVIQDENGNVYRIIPMEYKFLKKYGLPLPRKHWLERLKQHFV